MKFLIALWRLLSIPLILAGAALIWFGVKNWGIATADVVVDAKTLFHQRPDVAQFRDSVRFDLTLASLREESFMGIKSPVRAAFPAWVGKDSSAPRLVVISSKPRILGPVIKAFMRIDSAEGEIRVHSKQDVSVGNLQPQFDALVQVLAGVHRDHLKDSATGWMVVQGVAIRETDSERAQLNSIAQEFWEIRTEGVPTREQVLTSVGAGIASVVLGLFLQISVGRWERRKEEEEEEERLNEQPLV